MGRAHVAVGTHDYKYHFGSKECLLDMVRLLTAKMKQHFGDSLTLTSYDIEQIAAADGTTYFDHVSLRIKGLESGYELFIYPNHWQYMFEHKYWTSHARLHDACGTGLWKPKDEYIDACIKDINTWMHVMNSPMIYHAGHYDAFTDALEEQIPFYEVVKNLQKEGYRFAELKEGKKQNDVNYLYFYQYRTIPN